MKGIDRVGNSFSIDDHDNFVMERDEIFVRHTELLAVRQFQSERMKTILQPASDLFDDHGRNLLLHENESMLYRTSPRSRPPVLLVRLLLLSWDQLKNGEYE